VVIGKAVFMLTSAYNQTPKPNNYEQYQIGAWHSQL